MTRSAKRLAAGVFAGLLLAACAFPVLAAEPFVRQLQIGTENDADRPESLRAIAISPDGGTIACAGEPGVPTQDHVVQIRSAATGELIHRLPGHESAVRSLAFATDGGRLATITSDPAGKGTVRLFDTATGQQVQTIDTGGTQVRMLLHDRLTAAGFGRVGFFQLPAGQKIASRDAPPIVKQFSSDARWLVGVSHHGSRTLEVREMESGTPMPDLIGCSREPTAVAFSPDGRTVAAADARTKSLLVWEVRTGQVVHTIEVGQAVTALEFSSGGRYLLAGSVDQKIRAWEVATGSPAGETDAHTGALTVLTSGPGGLLLSGGTDRRVIVWSLAGLTRSTLPTETLDDAELDDAWDSLATGDAQAAYRTLGRIARDSQRALPAMATRVERQLLPVTVADRERLLLELDHVDYAVRERAMATLREAGEAVRPFLEKHLSETNSPEVRARLRELLRHSGQSPRFRPSDLLRLHRLIAVAESIANDDARRLLQLIADDDTSPPLANDAHHSLQRLDHSESTP